eukprot:scaffold3856_cov276-Prasinococcus_capsulatus_cf.AAC.1
MAAASLSGAPPGAGGSHCASAATGARRAAQEGRTGTDRASERSNRSAGPLESSPEVEPPFTHQHHDAAPPSPAARRKMTTAECCSCLHPRAAEPAASGEAAPRSSCAAAAEPGSQPPIAPTESAFSPPFHEPVAHASALRLWSWSGPAPPEGGGARQGMEARIILEERRAWAGAAPAPELREADRVQATHPLVPTSSVAERLACAEGGADAIAPADGGDEEVTSQRRQPPACDDAAAAAARARGQWSRLQASETRTGSRLAPPAVRDAWREPLATQARDACRLLDAAEVQHAAHDAGDDRLATRQDVLALVKLKPLLGADAELAASD